MKKWISFVLVLLLCCQLVTPVLAESDPAPYGRVNDRIPTINIAGDGNAIFVPDETAEGGERQVFYMREREGNFDSDSGSITSAVTSVMLPFLKEGILKNNWDPFYENLQAEVSDLFAEIQLDKNGNAQYGTTLSGWCNWVTWYNQNNDNKGEKGYYDFDDYHFWYDWRLDPMENARTLHEYIQNVKRMTGSDKVSILSSCLGSNAALAYTAQFGTDDLYGLAIDATTANGSEFISEAVSGGFKLDGNAIVRFFESSNATGMFNLSEFIIATIDLATKAGLLDGVSGLVRATIYDKVVEGVTSALALGTMFTMPCYWACVDAAHYDEAIRYVFGEEGSAKRQEYAGLIEKLDNYHNVVACHVPDLLQTVADNGVYLAVVAKYGLQMVPISTSRNVISDEFASLTAASFGATTADSIYDTLPDEYIAQRVAEGKGKYISPDKQVDASTCMFPDQTWFIKGATHTIRTEFEDRWLYTCITADRQLTIDDCELTQFMVYDNATRVMSPMTEENCQAATTFTADRANDEPANFFVKIKLYVKSLAKWLKLLAGVIKDKISEKINGPQPDAEA